MKLNEKFGFAAKFVSAVFLGVVLGISPFTSFGEDVPSTGLMFAQYCNHNITGDSSLSTFCQLDRCAHATGVGSNVAPCGYLEELPPGE
jgi:hypothetical protein